MGIVFVRLFFALSAWSLVALLRRFRRERAGPVRWIAFGLLAACGAALGAWCSLNFEYHAGARLRIGGFPLPPVFFHLEDGNWVDFPVPDFQMWPAVFANILTI